jgi:hypothetical protein
MADDSYSRRAASQLSMRIGALICFVSSTAALVTFYAREPNSFVIGFWSITFGSGVGLVLVGNLVVTRRITPSSNDDEIAQSSRMTALEKRVADVVSHSGGVFSVEPALADSIAEKVKETVSERAVQKIRASFIEDEHVGHYRASVSKTWSEMRERLEEEIFNLSKRANVSLFIGCITSVCGIGLLVYLAASKETTAVGDSLSSLLFWYGPRLPIVLFIEVFSYFFLRLYRVNLEKIEYFQNEMTNVESHFIALQSTILAKDSTVLKDVIKLMSRTERNARLKKNEATVALLREQAESSHLKDSREFISTVIKEYLNSKATDKAKRAGRKPKNTQSDATQEGVK